VLERYLHFIKGISISWWGKLGVILTTSSFVSLIILELARLVGIITSSYAGLVTYLLFPALFVIGLLLIPIGWLKLKRRTGKSFEELLKQGFDEEDLSSTLLGSKLFRYVGIFSIINIVFLIVFSTQMLGFMDSAKFCGTACHSVMNPEWVTYQQSPHSRVACVQCHVGEGAGALIDSKLNGVWQMVSVTFDLLERPIPTPVHQLRPARETCEKCHWPDKFYGTRLKTVAHYDFNEANTPKYSTLNLKIDAGRGDKRSGIHWHIAAENEVRYVSVEDKRKEIIWADVKRPDGNYNRYTNKILADMTTPPTDTRSMDCVDCHNRATHIYENPENAIDKRISDGLINESLPFIKKEALKAITSGYPDKKSGLEGIRNHIFGFYQRQYPELARTKSFVIDSVITYLQEIYSRNIHPEMNITWGTYASHIGHTGSTGCFRCHNSNMVDNNGNTISEDCTLCHSLLSNQEETPFKYLTEPDTSDINFEMYKYLRDEFFESY
jgi:hypothetical protein